MWYLANKLSNYRNAIAIVGCGGTGGFVAEGLCRLLGGHPQVELRLIDGDRVEEGNLGRQNFCPEDLGRFKAQALAERLARRYRHPVAYSVAPVQRDDLSRCALVVGCVDNAEARSAIAQAVSPALWWVDSGNGREFGQVLVGNAKAEDLRGAFDERWSVCHALPLPTWVRPELLVPDPGASCAEAVEQGPTVNLWMATLVVEAVRRLLEGRLAWWQGFLDLETFSLRTVPATPEAVSRFSRMRLKSLLKRGD